MSDLTGPTLVLLEHGSEVEVTGFDDSGRRILRPGRKVTVGRDPSCCAIFVRNALIGPRKNSAISVDAEGKARLDHLGHALPIRVNGEEITWNSPPHDLKAGDIIEFVAVTNEVALTLRFEG